RLNDLVYDEGDSYPLYATGSYDNESAMMIARFSPHSPVNAQPFSLSSGLNTATAIRVFADTGGLHLPLPRHRDEGCIETAMQPSYDSPHDAWTWGFDPFYRSNVFGFAGTVACYTDAMTVLPDHSQLAAGRVIHGDGSWSAFFQHFSPSGDRIDPS